MSRTLAKASAVRLIRSLARRGGFSEQRYEVRAASRAGACELWLRRKVGLQPPNPPPQRARVLRLGRGPTWSVAVRRAAEMLLIGAKSAT